MLRKIDSPQIVYIVIKMSQIMTIVIKVIKDSVRLNIGDFS